MGVKMMIGTVDMCMRMNVMFLGSWNVLCTIP